MTPKLRQYRIPKNALTELNEDVIFRINHITSTSSVDRFDLFGKVSNINFDTFGHQIPQQTNLTMEECCLRRCEQLSNDGEKIAVLWSGGVDSTNILCSFIKYGISPNRITVVYNKESIIEYPTFFEYLKTWGCSFSEFGIGENLFHHIEKLDVDIVVGGQCCDQLFQKGIHSYILYEQYNVPWKDGLYRKYITNFIKEHFEHDYFLYELYSKILNFPIDTFFDFVRMVNFGCAWEYNRYNFKLCASSEVFANKFCTFYETQDFQDWAISNQDIIVSSFHDIGKYHNWGAFKRPLKDIIFDVTHDTEYRDNKQKVASLPYNNIANTPPQTYPLYYCCYTDSGKIQNTVDATFENDRKLLAQYARLFFKPYQNN